MPTMNLEKIYTSTYIFFYFQQLFFYGIFLHRVFYELSVVKVYVYTTVLDRHKIQDSGHSNKWVLPYVLSNEARLSFNLWGKEINIQILPTVVKFG